MVLERRLLSERRGSSSYIHFGVSMGEYLISIFLFSFDSNFWVPSGHTITFCLTIPDVVSILCLGKNVSLPKVFTNSVLSRHWPDRGEQALPRSSGPPCMEPMFNTIIDLVCPLQWQHPFTHPFIGAGTMCQALF